MTLLKKFLITAVLVTSISISTQANADTTTSYAFDITNPPGSTGGGKITSLSLDYNETTEQLSFSSTIVRHNGHLADGFWLVLSDGENPKSNVDEYAIFYGDGKSGNLTSYIYDGVNSSNSWLTTAFIEGFSNGLDVVETADEITFSFDIDITNINAFLNDPEWDGASFAEKVGIWYHPTEFTSDPTYNQDGSLASFNRGSAGWYDTSNRIATKTITQVPGTGNNNNVPEPSVIWLMMTGLIGLFGVRRKAVTTNR